MYYSKRTNTKLSSKAQSAGKITAAPKPNLSSVSTNHIHGNSRGSSSIIYRRSISIQSYRMLCHSVLRFNNVDKRQSTAYQLTVASQQYSHSNIMMYADQVRRNKFYALVDAGFVVTVPNQVDPTDVSCMIWMYLSAFQVVTIGTIAIS